MRQYNNGIVFLIGAGPGDPDLITVRGKAALASCDAVVYDHLVPGELIVSLPENVERIYAGKQAGRHAMPQDEINRLLVKLARGGRNVARLKGGDPFVFGRGGEEARHLKEAGIPYEVVPGITAAVGGLAYAGIPCTDRTIASYAVFVTGHKAGEKEESGVPWRWIAEAEGGTIVVYMGVTEASEIVERLLSSGMPPDTPVGIVERGTLPTQRVFTTRLGRLPEVMLRNEVRPLALLCLGDVVELQPMLRWFESRPLFGRRIMVTRPADQAQELYASLRRLGAEVLAYPTIATREITERDVWARIGIAEGANRWLVFTSENGVRYFMRQFTAEAGDVRRLADYKIAAVGSGTARALKRFALAPDFVPDTATVAELAAQMRAGLDLQDALVIRVQGNLSDDTVPNVLTEAGARVIRLTVYETFTPGWPPGFKEQLLAGPPDVVMFSSGSTVDGLCRHLSAEELQQITKRAKVVSIGPMTTKHVQARGMKVALEAKQHSIPAMVEEMLAYLSEQSFERL